MRARNIKPGFFKNEDLAACSFPARLLFAGLWLLADREGRLEDRPGRIKAEVFPFDNVNCDELLQQLAARHFIVRYQERGVKCIQVTKFKENQNPHPHEAKSKLPCNVTACNDTHDMACMPCPSESLNPESLNPESNTPYKSPKGDATNFEAWWSTYPRKAGKQAAFKAWQRAIKRYQDQHDCEAKAALSAILDAARKFSQSDKAKGEFCPYPATWLNQGRFEDDPATWTESKTGQRVRPSVDIDNIDLTRPEP